MLVTVYTDASYIRSGKSGAAGYLVRNGERKSISGPLKKRYPDSNHAELASIGAVLWTAIKRGFARAGDRFLVVTDSKVARMFLNYATGIWKSRGPLEKQPNPVLKAMAEKIVGLVSDAKCTISEIRWVRGHQGGHDKQSWVNEHVDMLAKLHTGAA